MRDIIFYHTGSGACPVEAFLDTLPSKQAQKVAWVLQRVEEMAHVPAQYFQKLVDTEDLWEIRVQTGGNVFRLLGFFDGATQLVLCHGFAKKTRKTPSQDLAIAHRRKSDYWKRKGAHE
jgi:phage-related protein